MENYQTESMSIDRSAYAWSAFVNRIEAQSGQVKLSALKPLFVEDIDKTVDGEVSLYFDSKTITQDLCQILHEKAEEIRLKDAEIERLAQKVQALKEGDPYQRVVRVKRRLTERIQEDQQTIAKLRRDIEDLKKEKNVQIRHTDNRA